MTKHLTMDLVPASDYDRASYGIVLVSATQHDFTGPGIHNRHHPHTLQVWDNSRRPAENGQYIGPDGQVTPDRYSFSFTAHAVVITAHPDRSLRPARGPALALGDVLTLNIHGYEIGTIQCRARALHNPHGVLVDTASSASRQHYIETGDYLTAGEEF